MAFNMMSDENSLNNNIVHTMPEKDIYYDEVYTNNIDFENQINELPDLKDKNIIVERNGSPSISSTLDVENLKNDSTLIIGEIEIMKNVFDKWYYHAILLICCFICSYASNLDSRTRRVYKTYATSSYNKHSLLSTINVVNALSSAVAQIIIARASDRFGRIALLIITIIFYAVGTVIECQAYDIARYCAGAVLYNIGNAGSSLILVLILSDFSSLKWRVFYQLIYDWPSIINTWVAGSITSKANPEKHWSWDIGMWAFIFPLSCIPLLFFLLFMRWKASKTSQWKDLWVKEKPYWKSDTCLNIIIDLFWKLDVLGVIFIGISLGCILVPITLVGGIYSKWSDKNVIGPFATGFGLLPFIFFWEWKISRFPLIPLKLIKVRTVWAALCISFLIQFVYDMAEEYTYTFLVVAYNQSVASATRISLVSSFAASTTCPFFSLLLTKITRLKPFIVLGCCLRLVSMGILYCYSNKMNAGYPSGIIGGYCVWGFSKTLFANPVSVTLQAAVSHNYMAQITSLFYAGNSVGTGFGAAVAGSIWTQKLYKGLVIGMHNKTLATKAFASPYKFIKKHEWETPLRNVMNSNYSYVFGLEILVGMCFCAPLIVFSLLLRETVLTEKMESDNVIDGKNIDSNEEYDVFGEYFHQFLRIFSRQKGKTKDVDGCSFMANDNTMVDEVK